MNVPHDSALPQLATALDASAMATAFDHALGGARVRACRIDRIKYRPGRSCTVSYRVDLVHAHGGRRFEQRIAARFCAGGDSQRRYLKALDRAAQPSAAGPSLMHLTALDAVLHFAPNDAKLGALPWLAGPSPTPPDGVNDIVALLTQGRGRLLAHRTTVVQYVPEHRACARIELCLQAEAGATAVWQTVYAKADAERRGATTHAVMQALSDSAAQARGHLRTPASLAWHEDHGLHWQLGLGGQALMDAEPRVGAAASAQVGVQLAALHATPVPVQRTATARQWREQPRGVADLLARVQPAWKPVLSRLVRTLDGGAHDLEHQPVATLHGDLHPRNILSNAGRLSFIDLDSVRLGPAVMELGAWVADAIYREVLAQQTGPTSREEPPPWRSFLDAYGAACGRPVDEPLLAWSTAHNLLCQRALRSVVNLKPGRLQAVPRLLAVAERVARAASVDAATAEATPRRTARLRVPA